MPTLLGAIAGMAAANTAAVLASTLLVAVYLLLYRWQLVKVHPDEPPVVPAQIPFVGHLLGMAMHGGKYVKHLGLCHPDKTIFTLPVPRSRMYIVTDPSLAAAVQRASKTLSFTPLVPDITRRMLGLDDDTVAIVRQHIDPGPGEPRGFLADVHDLVYASLGPGVELDNLSLEAVRQFAKLINDHTETLQKEKRGEETVSFLPWIRHFVAVSTAHFLYGDENPLATHPELESAFWDFDHGLGSLLVGVFPSITARNAYRGREAVVAALEDYLAAGRHLHGERRRGASPIVQKKIAVALQHGWTLKAAARSELAFLFAGIVNTATTTFWMVLTLFASASSGDDNLLSAVRSELSSCLAPVPQDGTLTLSLDKLKTSSPTLHSLFRECLRRNSDNYSSRLVKSDTVLAGPGGPYHLAANSIVQISGGTIHADPRTWGADATKFNPLRFLANNQQRDQQKPNPDHGQTQSENSNPQGNSNNKTTPNNIHPAAFRAFGGGKTLCPGRHFATTSIQALVALLVTKFDIVGTPENGNDGKIDVPEKEDGVLPVHILEPKREVWVRVKVRDSRRVVVVS